jgi:hypothetical protein
VEEFGTFHYTRAEVWSQLYRYKVKIGIRILTVSIKLHIPSHTMHIARHSSIIFYKGQPTKCYICNDITKLATKEHTTSSNTTSSADVGTIIREESKRESYRFIKRNEAKAAADNDNPHHSPLRTSDPHTRILETAYTLPSLSLLHEMHQIYRPLYHVPSWRHLRKRNNQRHSLNIKRFRSFQLTSPLTTPQNSRWQYDPLRPL